MDAGELLSMPRRGGPRAWTDREDHYLRSIIHVKPLDEVAYDLKRTTYEVRMRARELGVALGPQHRRKA